MHRRLHRIYIVISGRVFEVMIIFLCMSLLYYARMDLLLIGIMVEVVITSFQENIEKVVQFSIVGVSRYVCSKL